MLRPQTLGWLVLSLAGVAGAQTSEPLDLSWDAPPECPGRASVYERIRTLAGSTPVQDERLKADATVVRVGDRFHLKLVLRSGNLVGERSIESDTCDALAGAAAVALVLLLSSAEPLGERELSGSSASAQNPDGSSEPGAPSRPSADRPAPPPAPVAPPAAATDDDATSRSHSDPTSRAQLLVQAPMVTLDFGPLPQPSGGAAAAAGLRLGEWHFLLGVQVSLPQTVPAEEFDGYAAKVWRQAAEGWFCHGFRWSRLELAPCMLLALERITASGESAYLLSSSASAVWFSGGAGVLGRWYGLDYLALVVGVGGRIEASRPKLEIRGLGSVDQLGPGAVTIRVGTEWIW
jgi:hypothetical protein